jgi:hypothetical protein
MVAVLAFVGGHIKDIHKIKLMVSSICQIHIPQYPFGIIWIYLPSGSSGNNFKKNPSNLRTPNRAVLQVAPTMSEMGYHPG